MLLLAIKITHKIANNKLKIMNFFLVIFLYSKVSKFTANLNFFFLQLS